VIRTPTRTAVRRIVNLDRDYAFCVRVWKWIEQNVLDCTEDRGGGADTEHQGQDCQCRETRMIAQPTQSIIEVLQYPEHTFQTVEALFCSQRVRAMAWLTEDRQLGSGRRF